MPKDSQLLTPASRALLRAARAGCIYIRHVDKEIEEEDKETTDPEEQAVPLQGGAERSFTARKWTQVPRHMEPPESEFLAKRRPGLPPLYGAAKGDGVVDGAFTPMRRTRFQKTDPATGNISIYDALVPEGYKIEGEIAEDAPTASENNDVPVKPEAPAPGTVVEGVGVADAEGVVIAETGSAAVVVPKRRPPPPKRKGRGFGKGRRKKVMFAPGEGADASTVHGAQNANAGTNTTTTSSSSGGGVKEEKAASRMSVDRQTVHEDEGEDGDDSDESDDGDSVAEAKTPEPTTPPAPQPPSEHMHTTTTTTTDTSTPIKADVDKQPSNQDLSSIPTSDELRHHQTATTPGSGPGLSETSRGASTTTMPNPDFSMPSTVRPVDEKQPEDTTMTDAPLSSEAPDGISRLGSQQTLTPEKQNAKFLVPESARLEKRIKVPTGVGGQESDSPMGQQQQPPQSSYDDTIINEPRNNQKRAINDSIANEVSSAQPTDTTTHQTDTTQENRRLEPNLAQPPPNLRASLAESSAQTPGNDNNNNNTTFYTVDMTNPSPVKAPVQVETHATEKAIAREGGEREACNNNRDIVTSTTEGKNTAVIEGVNLPGEPFPPSAPSDDGAGTGVGVGAGGVSASGVSASGVSAGAGVGSGRGNSNPADLAASLSSSSSSPSPPPPSPPAA